MNAGTPVQHEGCRSQLVGPESLLTQSYAVSSIEFNSAPSACDCLAHRFANAADRPERVRKHPSDVTDAEWAVVRDARPVPGLAGGPGAGLRATVTARPVRPRAERPTPPTMTPKPCPTSGNSAVTSGKATPSQLYAAPPSLFSVSALAPAKATNCTSSSTWPAMIILRRSSRSL